MDSIIPGRPEPSRPPSRLLLRTWQALSLPMLLFFAVPVVLLFTRTGPLEWLDGFHQPQVYQAIAVSMKTSLISLVITILAGTPVAYLMGRQQFRFKKLVDTLIDLPIVLPLARPALLGGCMMSWARALGEFGAAILLVKRVVPADE